MRVFSALIPVPHLALFAISVPLAACGGAEPTYEACEIAPLEAGVLATEGTRVLDSHGRTVSLRGINTGGRSKYAPYMPFDFDDDNFDAALATYLDRAESWGFSVLRVPFSWAAMEPAPGVWDEVAMARYDALLDGAWERGMWTIVDFHQDIYAERFCGDGFPDWTLEGEGEPRHDCETWFMKYSYDDDVRAAFAAFWTNENDVQGAFANMWRVMSARHADRPGVIGFEIMNEPHPGDLEPDAWAAETMPAFYSELAGVIREAAPEALVFFDSTGVDATMAQTSLGQPDGEGLVFAPHYYDAGALFDWELSQDVGQMLSQWADVGIDWDLPVLVGEYGIHGEHADREAYLTDHYDAFDAHGLHGTLWEYSDSVDLWNGEDLSMIDPTGAERTVQLGVIVRPVVRALAGAEAEVSHKGGYSLSYTPAGDGHTEIIVPSWSLGTEPDAWGLTVEGGCADIEGNRLRVQAHEDANQVVVGLTGVP